MWHWLKKSFFFGVCALFVLCALFPKAIFLKCVEWQAIRYCTTAFGGSLYLEGVALDQGTIVFKEGRLLRGGELEASFSKAALVPQFDWKRRIFKGELKFFDLKIVHKKNKFQQIPTPPPPSFKFFKLELTTLIENGELFLNAENFTQKACFELKHQIFDLQTCGTISFLWSDNTPKMTTHFHTGYEGDLNFTMQFHSHPFPILADLIIYFFPNYLILPTHQWKVHQGVVEGEIEVSLIHGDPIKLKGDMTIENLIGQNPFLGLNVQGTYLSSHFDLDFSDPTKINGDFKLTGGELNFGEAGDFWGKFWDIKNLESALSIREGRVENSLIQGTFLGLEGTLSLDWLAQETLMHVAFHGRSQEMMPYIPVQRQKSFAEAFPEDQFLVEATLKRSQEGLQLEGEVVMIDASHERHQLTFGSLLGRGKREPLNPSFLPQEIPFSISESVAVFFDQLKEQFCISEKFLGWFQGEQFPVDKFFAPFFLHDFSLKTSGKVDFIGTFDERYLMLCYEGDHLSLESPHFVLEANTATTHPSIKAIHYFDLTQGTHIGFLPLHEGKYWQKKENFLLEQAKGLVYFENRSIIIKNIETFASGIKCNGSINLKFPSPDDIDLIIEADHISGTIKEAQSFFSHLKPSLMCDVPLHGTLLGEEHSLYLHYHFSPTAKLITGSFDGMLHFKGKYPLFSIEDAKGRISYRTESSKLTLSHCEGTLSCNAQAPLFISIPELTFYHFPEELMDFHGTILNQNGEIQIFKGISTAKQGGRELIISSIGREGIEKIFLKTVKDKHSFKVEEFCFGDCHGEGTFQRNPDAIVIDYLKWWIGNEKRVSLKGVYSFKSKCLEGCIEEFLWPLNSSDNTMAIVSSPHSSYEGIAIENMRFVYDCTILTVWSDFFYKKIEGRAHLTVASESFNAGRLKLFEKGNGMQERLYLHPDISSSDSLGMSIEWIKKPDGCLTIKNIEGHFYGIRCSLEEVLDTEKGEDTTLTGYLGLTLETIAGWIPDRWKKLIDDFALGGIYNLEGLFKMHRGPSDIKFSGMLTSHALQLCGITLSSLSSQCDIEHKTIRLKELMIKDWAGRLFINELVFNKKSENWCIALDRLNINDVRISRLKCPRMVWEKGEKPFFRSLFIPSLVLENCYGECGHLKSFSGRGSVEFTNFSKKTFLSNLLFLPTEITARIGLDLTTLFPASGKIDYQIAEGRFNLTEFREVYSEGKRSRFYLVPHTPAYIDFSGHLNLKIKMKQYNLLMKLAEFFTINVKGSLLQPTYSFNNQLVSE